MGDVTGCPVLAGYDPLDPEELREPFASYARARHEAPVFFSERYGFWSVTRREDILAVLRDTERFSNRMAIPLPLPPEQIRDRMPQYPTATALLFMDDPEHRPARRMVQAPFTPKRLRQMAPLIRTTAERLLRPDDADRRIDFLADYATPLALTAIADILGVPEQDFGLLEESIEGAFRIMSGTCPEDELLPLAEGQLRYWEYLQDLADERRQHPTDDFTSVLAGYVDEDGSRPTSEEIAGHINTILGAGFETSAQMMCSGVRSMLEQPDQWELLKADRSLLSRAVEECVRHRSIIKRNFRVALADVDVGGVTIPEGALVAILMQSANRDETAFPEPDRFDITRDADNLTFGRGMHFCLGAPLSKLEMRITLEVLLDLAPDLTLVEGQEIQYKNDVRMYSMEGMQVDLGAVPASRTLT